VYTHLSEHLIGLRWSRPTPNTGSLPPALDLLLDAAEDLAPGTHVGISVLQGDAIATLAGTSPMVFLLDQLQHDLDDGPSLTAIRAGHTVIVDDATDEHRWPEFTKCAKDTGLRSVLAMPLAINDRTLGGVNFYSTTHTALSAHGLDHAYKFANQAAIVVAQSQREKDLIQALQSSSTIGKAVGLLMAQFCIDDDEAIAHLNWLIGDSSLTVLEVASALVDDVNDRWRSREPR
jgi:GAF domain-containing protein